MIRDDPATFLHFRLRVPGIGFGTSGLHLKETQHVAHCLRAHHNPAWHFGGGSGHGFTIVNARHEGLHVEGNGVTVAGNVAIGNGLSGHVAIAVVGIGNIIADNAAINNANTGIQVNDSSGTVTGNVASANLQGFSINTTGHVQFTQNVASGNRNQGLSSGVEIGRAHV